jgi:hypothetical protein
MSDAGLSARDGALLVALACAIFVAYSIWSGTTGAKAIRIEHETEPRLFWGFVTWWAAFGLAAVGYAIFIAR